MKGYCFTFRSITYAQQGQRLLQRNGLTAHLLRTPRWMEERGCGYCIQTPEREGEAAAAVLRGNGSKYHKLYRLLSEDEAVEVLL